MKWFRWYEGACEDAKFRVTARNAGVTVATVIAVWAALLEDASSHDHRGVAVRGEDFYATILDLPVDELKRVLEYMIDVDLIDIEDEGIKITKWNERQFETDAVDGTNSDRQRRWRQKRRANAEVTARNGDVTDAKRPDTDTDTDTERKKDADSADALSDAGASIDHRQRLFREGLAKLANLTGKGPDACRSFVGKCLKAAEDDAVIVLGLIEDAERNRIIDPAAWIVARLKPPGRGPPETAFQRGQRETREILDVLGRSSKNGGAADIGLLSDDRRK